MPLTIVLLHYHTHTPEPSLTEPHRTATRRRTSTRPVPGLPSVALMPVLPRTTSASSSTRRRDPYDVVPPHARAGAALPTAASECLVGGTSTQGPAGEPTSVPARPRATSTGVSAISSSNVPGVKSTSAGSTWTSRWWI